MQLNAYLNFDNKCEEAFKFYQEVLGGSNLQIMRFAGSPMESHVPPEARNAVMHARMDVAGSTLMGSDGQQGRYHTPTGFAVSIGLNDPAEAERIFHALAEGGQVQMPIQQTFWALRFAMLVDRYNIPWMINCEQPK